MSWWGALCSCPDELVPRIAGMWGHSRHRDGVRRVVVGGLRQRVPAISARSECRSELMKLPQALFSYTEKLMTSFLAGHSSRWGEAISKPAQVCVVSENMVHGRGQSPALSWQLLKIGFRRRTHGAHWRWSLLWWHCSDAAQHRGRMDGRGPIQTNPRLAAKPASEHSVINWVWIRCFQWEPNKRNTQCWS